MKKKRGASFLIYPIVGFCVLCLMGIVFCLVFLKDKNVCGDETAYGECSVRKPYFCQEDKLVEKASICGCNENLSIKGDSCFSEYQTYPKNISLNYVLKGQEGEIEIVVYNGVADYLSEIPRYITSYEGENPSDEDFKLKILDEGIQKAMLYPLVVEIQNLDDDKTNQARIAISIVQKISFGNSEKSTNFMGVEFNHTRYPYEVLYDLKGVCEEKSNLLVFLLRELGYGSGFFQYSFENHEAVAIACPKLKSVGNTGYCFVETTGSSILTDNKMDYVGIGELYSEPELIVISEGNSLPRFLYEYRDARSLVRIRESIENKGRMNIFQNNKLEKLRKKYSLEEVYNA